MDIKVMRINTAKNSTGGVVFLMEKEHHWKFLCFCLEDEKRDTKIPGETRIPSGRYPLKIREYGGFYNKYTQKFSWHKGMIEIANIPNFKDVLIHIGNTEKDTSGCLLVGKGLEVSDSGENKLLNSTQAYKQFYETVYPLLERGEKIHIHFIDFDN